MSQVYLTYEDFVQKVGEMPQVSREELDALIADEASDDVLFDALLPWIASTLKNAGARYQSLELLYRTLSKTRIIIARRDYRNAADLTHTIDWAIRQETIGYLCGS